MGVGIECGEEGKSIVESVRGAILIWKVVAGVLTKMGRINTYILVVINMVEKFVEVYIGVVEVGDGRLRDEGKGSLYDIELVSDGLCNRRAEGTIYGKGSSVEVIGGIIFSPCLY